jgi:hypothetical protein
VARILGLEAPAVGSVVKVGVAGGVVAFPGDQPGRDPSEVRQS